MKNDNNDHHIVNITIDVTALIKIWIVFLLMTVLFPQSTSFSSFFANLAMQN